MELTSLKKPIPYNNGDVDDQVKTWIDQRLARVIATPDGGYVELTTRGRKTVDGSLAPPPVDEEDEEDGLGEGGGAEQVDDTPEGAVEE